MKREVFPRILIAGGGTGGHIFPAIAVAQKIRERMENSEILFVIGKKDIERKILLRYGFPFEELDLKGLKGRNMMYLPYTLLKFISSILKALSIVRGFSPHLVLGMGGYLSAPICISAKMLKKVVALQEQNTIAGVTNRYLSHISDMVFCGFEEAKRFFPKDKVYFTGNPVREEILKLRSIKKEGRDFTVLVFGGSQGSITINRVFLEAVKILKRQSYIFNIIHQTGLRDYHLVKREYEMMGIRAEVFAFIDDIAEAYQRSDLIISRAGAISVSEICAVGRASILIPYPYAADNHQRYNAEILRSAGASIVIEEDKLDPEILSSHIKRLLLHSKIREQMAECAKGLYNVYASDEIAGMISDTISRIIKRSS